MRPAVVGSLTVRIFVVVVLVGCRFEPTAVSGGDPDADIPPADGADPSDADLPPPIDATADARFGSFGPPTLVAELSLADARDDDPTLTADMLEIYFESDRDSTTAGVGDVYVSRRDTTDSLWSLPDRVDALSTDAHETSMEISGDGLTIYFGRDVGNVEIFRSRRMSRTDPWSPPELVPELNSPSDDYSAAPTLDHLTVFLGTNRPPAMGGSDIYRATRTALDADWSTPEPVVGLDTGAYEVEAFQDAFGVTWFTADLPGTQGAIDLWRSSLSGPERVVELASDASESDAWLSPDGHTIYFTSTRGGSYDIFTATR